MTIDVTWKNPGESAGPLIFSVVMDTHSVDLDGVDLAKQAALRNDQGREVKPEAWDALAEKFASATDAAIRERVRDLNVLFGDGRALDEVRRVALDENAGLPARQAALRALIASRAGDGVLTAYDQQLQY